MESSGGIRPDPSESMNSLPLRGIKVIEACNGLAGTNAAVMLGDLGADVIKVEGLRGEHTRGLTALTGTATERAITDAYWLAFNRNKRAIAMDFTKPAGREIMYKLLKTADVFVQNLRPGAAERHGLGYEDLRKLNPRLIYASVSGFGSKGPKADWIAFDVVAQGVSGLAAANALEGCPPLPTSTTCADTLTSWMEAYGIMIALYHRERTGEGQQVEGSLLRAMTAFQAFEIGYYLLGGSPMPRNPRGHFLLAGLFGTFRVKDGWIAIGGVHNDRWAGFCRALGIEQYQNDPRFADSNSRSKNAEELIPIVEEALGKKTREEWMPVLREADAIVGPVNTYLEAIEEPQMYANDFIVDVEDPKLGKIKLVNVPVSLSKTPARIKGGYPALGEHNGEILQELGYSEADISDLIVQGIIGFA